MPDYIFYNASMVEAPKSTREISPRKEILGEPATAKILAAIGSHEGRALLLLTLGLGPGNSAGATDLGERIRTHQGVSSPKVFSTSTIVKWCDPTIINCGLASKHTNADGTTEYAKTKEGQIAEALAGPLLELSESDEQASLSQLVGVNKSGISQKAASERDAEYKVIAPLTRLRIYRELVAAREKLTFDSLIDTLMTKYPEDYVRKQTVMGVIQTHLYNAARPDIVTITLGKERERTARYSLRAEGDRPEKPPLWTESKIIPSVRDIISASDELPQRDNIYDALQMQSPTLVADMSTQRLLVTITQALQTLSEKGYLGRKLFTPIWDIVSRSGVGVPVDRNDILDKIITKDPQLAATINNISSDPPLADAYTHTLLVAISRSLRYLEREGYIDHTDERTEIKSIEVTSAQRERLSKYIQIVDDFRSLDSTVLSKGMTTADRIREDPQRYLRLMTKAKEHGRPQISPTETAQQIYYIVSSHPEGIALRQITEELFDQFEHPLGPDRVRDYLDTFEEAQLLSSVQEGSNRKKKYTNNKEIDIIEDQVNNRITQLFTPQEQKTPKRREKRFISIGEKRKRAAEATLRLQILSGELKAGEPLDVQQLLERHSISRPTLGKIFRQLDSEGLLDRKHGRHDIIVQFPAQQKPAAQKEPPNDEVETIEDQKEHVAVPEVPSVQDTVDIHPVAKPSPVARQTRKSLKIHGKEM